MTCIVVRPDLQAQFDRRMPRFCLVVDEGNPFGLSLAPSNRYAECSTIALQRGESLADLLDRAPHEADLLVVCPRTFTSSPDNSRIGPDRRLSVMPCASTPVTAEQLGYFLQVCERTDHQALQDSCDRILQVLERSEQLLLSDAQHGTKAVFETWHDYEWNQQAGPINGGEQQIAPAGELSAVPVEITRFDSLARLRLSGQLALHGAVIVHRSAGDSHLESERLHQELAALGREPLVLDIEAGLVTGLRPSGPEAKPSADALELLFATDDSYRVVWEFGLGLNTAIRPVDGNCGLNEMYGGTSAILHLGLGLTPTTRFALTFHCTGTTVRGDDDVLAAPARRTLSRRRSAGCGCDESLR